MKTKILKRMVFAAGAAALCSGSLDASAQSVDALLNKLVDKGILSTEEAKQLKEESDSGFSKAYAEESGMPKWVSSLKFHGDVRARYEGFYSDAESASGTDFLDRNRFRYRLRFGATVKLHDNLEAGFRLTSSESVGTSGGDPISGNTSFQDNGSKKFIYVDQAYGRWTALNTPDWSGVLTVGKMENPFVFDDMVFDSDYTPEGAAIQLGYTLNEQHSLKLNTGGFVLDEVGSDSDDPYLVGAQLRWDASWDKVWSSSAGIAALAIQSEEMLSNTAVPNVNRGNTRTAAGAPAYNFNPLVADAAVTCKLASFPFYKGAFPIKVAGTYMNNPAAPSSADNDGWTAGITFGKSGKKGAWDVSYAYRWLGANAWWEELVDSDFGAFYAGSLPNSGLGTGYGAGTNLKGHIVRVAYSPADSLTLSARWIATELIHPSPGGADSEMNRVQVDAVWKF